MTYVVVDVEADGPAPGLYSMVSFGARVVTRDNKLGDSFYSGILQPISEEWVADALKVSGISRDDMYNGRHPREAMHEFTDWLKEHSDGARPQFYSDNNGFDWQFINYYFHAYCLYNPFGHSSRNINDLYKGLVRNRRKNFKHLRKTKHTHHPVDDATGNAEALIAMTIQHKYR